MKKQKSSTIVLTEFSSSDDNDENEKAMPKIDKEELRKYLQNSDDESQQNKTSPQKSKRVPHKIKTSSYDKAKKVISKDASQNYLVQGEDFKRLQKKAKKLGADSLQYSKRKNYKYVIEFDNKKIHFGSANTEDYLAHHDPVRREKYLSKAKKITDKETRNKETNFFNIVNKVQELCHDHLSREYSENQATSLTDVLYYKQIEQVDAKGKIKKKKDKSSAPVLYAKLIYSSDTKKFSTIFRVKGKKEVKPLDYKDKYFNTRMAIIFYSIYLGKTNISIQVKAHEVHILPFEERKSILECKENDEDENDENDDEVEVESEQEEDDNYENEEEIED